MYTCRTATITSETTSLRVTRHNVEWADLRGGTPLVSFNHVIDPHFVTFSSSLYTTSRNPNGNPNPNIMHSTNAP